MRRISIYLVCLMLLCANTALATTVSLYSGAGGAFTGATPWTTTVGGIVVNGYYWNGSAWQNGTLFGRNQTNDHGLGVCDPAEGSNCGTGSGGGDFNEVSNNLKPELIRLTLPTGYIWNSVQLSSLDSNGSTSSTLYERGILWGSQTGIPGTPNLNIGTQICTFAYASPPTQTCTTTGGIEPVLTILPANANTPYLFFQPYDWTTGGTNTNNDFLVNAATITAVPEPGSLMLLGTGLVGLAGAVRRKLSL